MAGVGYISAFDGLSIVTSSSVEKSVIGDTDDVITHFGKLNNGTKVNYDGTADAKLVPGKAEQLVQIHTGALTLYASIAGKKGMRGTVTKTLYAGGTETCTGVLDDVRIEAVHKPSAAALTLRLFFEFETVWA